MTGPFVWNVDPVLLTIGQYSLRYYNICFSLTLLTGFLVWYKRVQRFGETPAFGERILWYTVPAVFIGGRLGFCFFYQPETYLAHPERIFRVWEGGISSHGVSIGLAVAMWLFARRHQLTFLRIGDYIVPAFALAVGWIRIGNFFNSEVVGRATDVPWAVVFARHDLVPRHAAQLYDFAMGPVTWLVLREVERRGIRPIGSGLVGGVFLVTYFGMRLWVEQYKDFYIEQLRTMPPFSTIERWLGVPIHTGQWLSIIPVLIGVSVIAHALRTPQTSTASS